MRLDLRVVVRVPAIDLRRCRHSSADHSVTLLTYLRSDQQLLTIVADWQLRMLQYRDGVV